MYQPVIFLKKKGVQLHVLNTIVKVHWNRTDKATQARKILPDLKRWMVRRPKDYTFHLTQALSGHGCLRYYLHGMCRTPITKCLYGGHLEDTAENSLFDCSYWEASRFQTKASSPPGHALQFHGPSVPGDKPPQA